MTTLTITLDDEVLEQGRIYAQKHNLSLEDLVRQLLSATVENESVQSIEEWFKLMDEAHYNSGGKRDWKREDLYRV